MIKSEWKSIFKSPKMLISIIAVLFIPVMYAGMFLWAFWDPTGNVSDLPVAVVNLDEGAEYNGTELKLGEELSEKLKESKELNFISVSEEEADEGLARSRLLFINRDSRKLFTTFDNIVR